MMATPEVVELGALVEVRFENSANHLAITKEQRNLKTVT